MTSDGWYWCFTHDRVESADQRDDPDNVLGPYPTAEAAADWRNKTEQRAEDWKEADKAWSGDDETRDDETRDDETRDDETRDDETRDDD